MKKILLSLLLIFGIQSMKAGEFTYGICGDEINGVGTGMAGSNYSAAIEVPESVALALQGSSVTSVSVGFKSGLAKVIYIYLTYDLQGEPFYTQEGRVKVNTFNENVLDVPYVIEGRKFYIGYTYRQSSSTGKPIGFDGRDMGGMGAFSHIAVWPDEGEPEWDDCPQFGALSIRATIQGDKSLTDCAIPVGLRLPKAASLGKEFNYELDILNFGTNSLTDIETVSSIGSSADNTVTKTFDTPLAPGERGTVKFTASSNEENRELPVAVDVTKANGNSNLWASLPAKGVMMSSDFFFPRVVVIEEATGTGCGYCPAGYVALEQMREKHPDDYIGIAVHNYSGDPMYCASYEPWVDRNISGYPNATISRDPSIGTFSPQPTTCEVNYQSLQKMLNIYFNVESEYVDENLKDNVKVAVTTRFGYDIDNSQYAIALVETEDNVGPYNQRNNYSGGAYGEMYGFEDLPGYVSLMYNDVARAIYNWQGKPGSLPTSVQAGKNYYYDETIPLKTEKSKHKDVNIIALLIDRSTGEITTAAKCKIDKISGIGLAENAPAIKIHPAAGAVSIEGEFDHADIYGIDGCRKAYSDGPSLISLPAGLYIVRVAAGSSEIVKKIIIR